MAAGDERALEALYNTHGARIYNYALRLLNGAEADAEEVVQDTFWAAWRSAGRWRGEARVTTWLLRIAHHRAVERLKSRQIKQDRLTAGIEEFESWLPDGRSLAAFEQIADREQLQQALDSLSTTHRAVVELIFGQGLSYAEVADIMHSPLGTVRSRVHYAVRQLRRRLTGR
jgi:RNA polymerase sigma-70 factor, ECF subfamily